MSNWKNLLIYLGVAISVLAVGGVVVGLSLTHFLVDWWWFKALHFEPYFWLRHLYRYVFGGGVTLMFFLIFFLNFWAGSRYLGVDESEFSRLANSPEGSGHWRILHRFQTGSMQVYLPLSFVLACVIALPFHKHWEESLLFFFGPSGGGIDPVFNQDIAFYLFRLPLFKLIQNALLGTSIVLFAAMTLLYWIEHHVVPTRRKQWPKETYLHLTVLAIATLLIQCWGFMLDRYDLLYTDRHEPVFFGPGFTEMNYYLPLIWLCIAAFAGASVALLYFIYRGKGLRAAAGFGVIFVIALGLRNLGLVPEILDKYIVKPNPVKTDRANIQANIDATLAAYGLSTVKTVNFDQADDINAEIARIGPALKQHLDNIPIWDDDLLDEVFQQMQGIRPYYNFSPVDVGRYSINGHLQQVGLAAREVNLDKLPDAAKTWENRHLRYTHGFGAVMIPAAQRGEEPMQWYLRDLEQQSPVGFKIAKPDIYYGLENLDYAIVPNRLDPVDISTSEPDTKNDYLGEGGIDISSLFRKLLFATYFQERNIFFSWNIDANSHMLFRRNIIDRAKTLAPFLQLDSDPYVAITPDRVYWVLDAYTLSENYPVSKFSKFTFKTAADHSERQTFNYIRNSVKVVVDAYSGLTDFYISDNNDPIIQAYRRAYPGMFKDIAELPPLLREQLRYPRDLFGIQMQVYSRYHQTNPEQFYQQSETWDVARNVNEEPVKPMRPYYLTITAEGCDDLRKFVLVGPMTPVKRDNLSVLALGGPSEKEHCGLDYAGQLVIYKLPQKQVDGPAQINALIDQDPEIRQQFTLWDQRGSRVKRGRTIILPIGHSMVYIQPVYMISSHATRIPELVRIIVSMGNEVVMDNNLDTALQRLLSKLKADQAAPMPAVDTPPAAPTPAPTVPTAAPF